MILYGLWVPSTIIPELDKNTAGEEKNDTTVTLGLFAQGFLKGCTVPQCSVPHDFMQHTAFLTWTPNCSNLHLELAGTLSLALRATLWAKTVHNSTENRRWWHLLYHELSGRLVTDQMKRQWWHSLILYASATLVLFHILQCSKQKLMHPILHRQCISFKKLLFLAYW